MVAASMGRRRCATLLDTNVFTPTSIPCGRKRRRNSRTRSRLIERSDIQTDMHNSSNPVNDNPTPLQRTAAHSAQNSKRHRRHCIERHGSEALQNALGTKEKNRESQKAKQIVERPAEKHIGKRRRSISKPPCVSLTSAET